MSDQHVDLFAYDPHSGASRFLKRLALDAPELFSAGGRPSQLAEGSATYVYISKPHAEADCPHHDAP